MAGRRKKRFWSDDEKRSICLQAAAPGVSVAQVARRYAMNANLIFKWLKDPRFAPEVVEAESEPAFFPVEISPAVSHPEPVGPSGLGTAPFLFDDCRSGNATQAQLRISALQDKTATEVSVWPPMKALGPLVAESYSLTNGRNGWERNAFQYGNVAPLVNRIHRFVEDPMFSAVVDTDGTPRTAPLDWRREASDLVANIFGDTNSDWRVHIVDLRRVAHDLMPFILGSLLELFAFEIFERGQDQKVPTLLVLEEAHHYLRPVGVGESDTGSSLAYERLAKEGRKFGLALWLSTQRPSEISQTVLSQCGNWVSFRLASDRDLAAVQASSEWADRRDVKRISGLARQNAVAFGESLRMPVSLIAPTASPTPKSSDAPFDKWADSRGNLGVKAFE